MDKNKQGICILGATGSIGKSSLKVIEQHLDKYQIVALAANSSYQTLFAQIVKFKPKFAVLTDISANQELKRLVKEANLTKQTMILDGFEALNDLVCLPEVDQVISAIVGAKGAIPTLTAAIAGKKILLANKESIVIMGDLLIKAAKENGAIILPVDSEHNAIFQSMPAGYITGNIPENVEKLILTASGGPFFNTPIEKFNYITVEQALNHPVWNMGSKISIDSATMMNKGLEVIEAKFLFNMDVTKIDVVIHPQSIVHSLVQYTDGAVIAELGHPDMCTPIANCLAWPNRINIDIPRLDLIKNNNLEFYEPDLNKFKCLSLAFDSVKASKVGPCVLNASNEVAVEYFLQSKIKFIEIADIIEQALNKFGNNKDSDDIYDLNYLLELDKEVRRFSVQEINNKQ